MSQSMFTNLILSNRLLFITFLAVIFAIMTLQGEMYGKIFPEDNPNSDFTNMDVPFNERLKLLVKYNGYFILFVLVYFISLILAILGYFYMKASSDFPESPDHLDMAMDKVKELIWKMNDHTSASFFKWLIVALLIVFLIFIIYSLLNKSFITEMMFPTSYSKDPNGFNPNELELPTPQPKIYIVYYAIIVLTVICLGILLSSCSMDGSNGGVANEVFVAVIAVIYTVTLLTIIIATLGFYLKKQFVIVILMLFVLMLTIYVFEFGSKTLLTFV